MFSPLTMQSTKARRRMRRLGGLVSVIQSLLLTTTNATDDPSNITTLTAHPAMFGERWTSVVTTEVRLVNADLCSDEWDSSSNISATSLSPAINYLSGNSYVALYHDPTEQTGQVECNYAFMARIAQKMYPDAGPVVSLRSYGSDLKQP